MRIYHDHTEHYIQSLIFSVSKDPASFEGWECLHIKQQEEVAWLSHLLNTLKEGYKDTDCDVVHCSDGDVLFISRNLDTVTLHEIAEEFSHYALYAEGQAPEITWYDLYPDWQYIRAIFFEKAGSVPSQFISDNEHDFGDVDSLKEVFEEARKIRRSRHPIHVLLVDDDPLTRRIAGGSLKQDYAVIGASNASEAVSNYLLHAPDIVFLDIGLPDASGFDVLHQIMKTDPDAYVVMFSGNSYLDNIINALSHGASGFVAKPFKKEKMRHYIKDSAIHHHKNMQ